MLKNLFLISMSLTLLAFLGLYTSQSYQKYSNQKGLENYYSQELERIYTNGYAVDQKGQLIWSQNRFETAVKDIEKEMLSEGFHRGQIKQMKEEGRRKGQETRRFWDQQKSRKNQDEVTRYQLKP